jgi:hypothetical protein
MRYECFKEVPDGKESLPIIDEILPQRIGAASCQRHLYERMADGGEK